MTEAHEPGATTPTAGGDAPRSRSRESEAPAGQLAVLRAVVDALSTPVFSVDREYRYTSFNASTAAQMKALFGVDIELGACLLDFVRGAPDREVMRANLDAALGGRRVVDEGPVGADPTGRRYYEVTHDPLRDAGGDVVGVVVHTADITARKRAEEALREGRAKLDLALLASRMGVWSWDITEDRCTFDAQVCRLLGLDPVAFGGSAEEFYSAVHPEDRDALKAALARARESGGPYEPEYRVAWPDGSVHHVTARGRFEYDDAGTPLRINGVMWDVTERRHAEAALRMERDLGLALSSTSDLEHALPAVLDAALRIEGVDCGGVYLVDRDDGSLDLVTHTGLPPEFVASASHYAADSANTRLVMAGRPVYRRYEAVAEAVGADAVRRHEGLRASAVVPISWEGRVLAALNLASHGTDEFPPEARVVIETLAAQVGAIVARVRAEADSAEIRRNLQTLFDGVEDFVFILDDTGRIADVNRLVLDRLGFTKEELVGQPVLAVHPSSRHAEALHVIAAMLAGERTYCPVPLQAKDGTLIPVETRVSPGTWAGRPALFGVSRDIKDRVRAEAETLANEARYRSLFQDSPVALWEEDDSAVMAHLDELKADGREDVIGYLLEHPDEYARCLDLSQVLDANRAAVELFEAESREELLARDSELYGPDRGRGRHTFWAAMLAGERTGTYEESNLTLGGRAIEVLETFTVVPGHEATYDRVYLADLDITGRRHAEEALRASEERLRSVVATMSEGLILIDPDGRIVLANPMAESILGLTRAEIESRNYVAPEWEILRPDGSPMPPEEMAGPRAMAERRAVHDVEMGVRRPDGSVRWISVSAAPVLNEAGDLENVVGTFSDVTERKLAEDEVRALNEELERRVDERTRELRAANRELEEFVYSVSHDLRAPLRAVDGFSHAVMEDHGADIGEQGRSDLQRVRAAAQRMGVLIDALLSLTRLSRRTIEHLETDLSAIARRIVGELREAEPERRVDAVIQEGVLVETDPALIGVVLENLLANAWKFSAAREMARIEFGAQEREGRRRFFVRDNGAGFDPTYAGRLFRPFQRLHGADEFPGTGIGLATVARVVDRLGGEYWAEGAAGEGATFWFTLGEAGPA